MWISRAVCLFMIYSFLGWIYETTLCTVRDRKWENRGFLYGPVVPIYGTGAIAITAVLAFAAERDVALSGWMIYLISLFGSAILEYVTSWALEALFHARWWDYSDLPLNLNGRISLFTSLGFGAGGLLIVYVLVPFFDGLIGKIPPIALEAAALVMVFALAVDSTLTVVALYRFDQIFTRADDTFNQEMSSIVDGVVHRATRMKQSIISKKTAITDQVSSMSLLARQAVHRVAVFKDTNKRVEKAKNMLRSFIRADSPTPPSEEVERGEE